MRTVPIEINGKTYDLCFSNRVLMRMEQEKIDAESTLGSLTMLSAMMEAGDRLARLEGREPKGFLTVDELADTMGPADIMALTKQMNEAQRGDRNVETVADPKNAAPTPPEA